MKISYQYLILFTGILLGFNNTSNGQEAAELFHQNCAACHAFGQKLVGPDLIGVNEKRSEELLISFIKSSQTMIKSGDPEAVAIYEEFNQTIMNDQPNLDDGQIRSILAYIGEETEARQGTSAEAEVVEIVPIEYSEADVDTGLLLFSGELDFENNGPTCISCHNVSEDGLMSGGLLAKDLTHVYERMGDAGLAGILGSPPFPAMAETYENNELDSTEIAQLIAFLKEADSDEDNDELEASSGNGIFFLGGGGGLLVLFLLFALHWRNRIKDSTKHDIYKRQIKSV